MATFGSATAPSSVTEYLDALFTQSVEQYQKGMVDAIGNELPFMNRLISSGSYEESKGTYLKIPLMYQIGTMDSYAGKTQDLM